MVSNSDWNRRSASDAVARLFCGLLVCTPRPVGSMDAFKKITDSLTQELCLTYTHAVVN